MKKILAIVAILFSGLFGHAQDHWKIKLNGKVLLSSSDENESLNKRKVKKTEWKKQGTLDILYKEVPVKAGWHRSLLFMDETENELTRKDSIKATTRIQLAQLRKLFEGKKKVKIYTISLPDDPALAATIRVRRVHLCTLELE